VFAELYPNGQPWENPGEKAGPVALQISGLYSSSSNMSSVSVRDHRPEVKPRSSPSVVRVIARMGEIRNLVVSGWKEILAAEVLSRCCGNVVSGDDCSRI